MGSPCYFSVSPSPDKNFIFGTPLGLGLGPSRRSMIVFSLDMTLQVMRILSIQMESFLMIVYSLKIGMYSLSAHSQKYILGSLWKGGFTQLRLCSLSSINSHRAYYL